mgnify:CR=1 FL=1
MDCVYWNCDGLDMSFHGLVSMGFADALEEAKARAQEAKAPAALEFAGVNMLVRETGRRGGFAYVFDTGEDGEVWAVKAPVAGDDRGAWAVSVSPKSASFVQHGGPYAVRARVAEKLLAFGFTPTRCPKSGRFDGCARVDFAADFLVPEGFVLDPASVASKGSKTAYSEGVASDGAELHWRGRRVTGCTVGRMPNRQVCIYDKVADIVAKGKDYWWDAWGLEPGESAKDRPRVWRVELRAGKDFLRDVWKLGTIDDVLASLGDVMADTLDKIRLVEPIDSNVTRCPDAPLWTAVRRAVMRGLEGCFTGLAPSRVRETVRGRLDATMRQLLSGIAVTHAAVTLGRADVEGILDHIDRVVTDIFGELRAGAEETRARARKALDRYKLLEISEWETRMSRPQPDWLPA